MTYRVCGLEEYAYPPEAFDLVLSNLALHYVADLDAVYRGVFRTLRSGGTFVCNIEHPTFTAGVGQQWVREGSATCTGPWTIISIPVRAASSFSIRRWKSSTIRSRRSSWACCAQDFA